MNQTITIFNAPRQRLKSCATGANTGTQTFRSTRSRPARTIWMPWTPGTKANTPIAEASFVVRLEVLARGKQKANTRSDTTAVLNALRCGLVVDDLLEQAPGLDPARILGAYRALDELRERASTAWSLIAADMTREAVFEFGEEAGKLLPSLVGRLYAVIQSSPDDLGPAIRKMAASVQIAESAVRVIEQELHISAVRSEQRTSLGRLLYDPRGAGATSRPDYLARRVGTLVPTAVAALLGERVDISTPPPRGAAAR
ncbi:MAG: hypothetical protein ACI9ME_000803 [Ilumatobacter sp.]|jgi:hypothetical protein